MWSCSRCGRSGGGADAIDSAVRWRVGRSGERVGVFSRGTVDGQEDAGSGDGGGEVVIPVYTTSVSPARNRCP